MDITWLSRDKVKTGLHRAVSETKSSQNDTRLLFSPREITENNFNSVCEAYVHADSGHIDTVVVVESSPGDAEKKLVMPSFKTIETHLGKVAANDRLRNDFADEDDDFFINDNAFDDNASLYHQLVMLQCTLDNFTVSHIQITDENSIIIKELALALEEILASKKALLVCCCDLEKAEKEEINHIMDLLNSKNDSGLMNYLNSGNSAIGSVGSFIAGLLVAGKWGLKTCFTAAPETGTIQAGYAVLQDQLIIG